MPTYRFLFRLESARGDQLSDIPKQVSEGLSLASFESEYRALVVNSTVDAEAARIAAIATAQRLVRLLALNFSAFRVTGMKAWGSTSTLGELEGQPWHPLNASITEHENGQIGMMSASGYATRSAKRELAIWRQAEGWSERVRTALDIFWEAQCTEVRDVKHLLLVALLEVLVGKSEETPVLSTIPTGAKDNLLRVVRAACRTAGLPTEATDRLLNRFVDTLSSSATHATRDYLRGRGQGVPDKMIRDWSNARNRYVHAGKRIPPEINVDELNGVLGMCLRSEIGL